mgnify:CR=1 FL=1
MKPSTPAPKWAAKAVVRFLRATQGEEIAHSLFDSYRAWEQTPMPVGAPSWGQIADGLVMAAQGIKEFRVEETREASDER